jgi:hypothetical protein
MKDWRPLLKILLIALSVTCLAIATFAGLMHQWHRLAFISFAWLDYSLPGTLALLLGGIVLWIGAACLSDEPDV